MNRGVDSDIDSFLSGARLYGDDFDASRINAWFKDEENAYVELRARSGTYEYEYAALNVHHGFRHLPDSVFPTVLGIGSAYGDELSPISERIGRLIIVEAADSYRHAPALEVPTEWYKAAAGGDLNLPDGSVDLVTCFGVLHHIPNVSSVVMELGRVTRSGGYLLLREPIVSMGDWSKPRPGLTPHERGIPRSTLLGQVRDAGFEVEHEALCFFSGTAILARMINQPLYDKTPWIILDEAVSRLFAFNYRYHATTAWRRLRPRSTFIVARRN